MRTLKSENSYAISYGITMDDILMSYNQGKTITGMVIDYNVKKKIVKVNLGNNIIGVMPWSEVTVQEFTYKKCEIPDQIIHIKYRKVRVKILEIADDGTILLSRKNNQMEYWKEIMTDTEQIFRAEVTGMCKTGLFLDIGEGIIAFCNVVEYSSTRINTAEWVKIGDVCDVVLIMDNYNPEKKFFIYCSRKRASSKTYYDFKKEDIVTVRIAQPVYQNDKLTGFFVELAPNISGIADILPKHFMPKVGDYVMAVVTKNSPEDLKMKLDIIDSAKV